MSTVLKEVFVSLSEFTFYPESPFTYFWAAKHQSPAPARIDPDGMLVLCWERSGRPFVHSDFAFGIDVGVATTQNESAVVPRVIVKMPLVV